jgi:hypothetical protein
MDCRSEPEESTRPCESEPSGRAEAPPRSCAVAEHASSSESSPPRQRSGGGKHGGTGVAEQGSRGVGHAHRERSEAGQRAGGDQAERSSCIAVEDRARQEERGSDGDKGDGRHVPRGVDHGLSRPRATEAT